MGRGYVVKDREQEAMNHPALSQHFSLRLISGFGAGLVATLVGHQGIVALLWSMGIAPLVPYSLAVSHPFGIPVFLSLAFWGGVWGIVFAMVEGSFPHGHGYWATAFLFGAILPTLVALLVVLPLKGKPLGGGWHLPLLATALLANGAWGVVTGALVTLVRDWLDNHHHHHHHPAAT